MVKIMIDIISYSVTALLFWYYARTLFGSKYKVPVQLLCTFAVFGILMALNQFSNPFINYSSWFVLDLLLLIFVYQVRLKSAVLHAFLFPLIVLAGEFIDIILYSSVIRTDFNYVNSDMTMYGVVNFLSKLFLLTFVIILIRIFSKDKNIRTRNYLSIAIVPMTNAIIMLVFRYITIEIDVTSTIFYLWMAAVVLLMVSSIFVFVNYHTTLKKSKELSDLKLEQQKNETDFAYLKLLEQKNEDMISSIKKVENRKCTFYRLTEQGKALYLKQQQYQKGLKAEVDTLLADYSDAEVEGAIRLLYRLERCIGEYHKQF